MSDDEPTPTEEFLDAWQVLNLLLKVFEVALLTGWFFDRW